ncbi:MAG: hypothetical protein JXQ29_09575 [Planctomycetes bacterium]|nr:hypothetical protein [Planctomycetota bacterium]
MGIRATRLAGAILLAAAMAAPATACDPNPPFVLKTLQLPTVAPGQSAWQMLYWQGGEVPVYDFQVTVKARKGMVVNYPSEREFTSLWKDSTLRAHDVDFTAFKLDIPVYATKSEYLEIEVRYAVYVAPGKSIPGLLKTKVLLPIELNQGADYQLLTYAVGPIAEESAVWVALDFRGAAPKLEDFRAVVADAQGATVSYPGGNDYTSLSEDSVLQAAETDCVAFHIDTTGMASSLYTLAVDVSYRTVFHEARKNRHFVLLPVGLGTEPAVPPAAAPSLTTDIQRIQPGVTPEAVFSLHAGAEHAGQTYFLLGSFAGTSPGIDLGAWVLPLNPDAYFFHTLLYPNSGALLGSLGVLDSKGRAEARFRVAGSLPPFVLAEKWTVFHAFAVLDAHGVRFTSNWAPLTLVD